MNIDLLTIYFSELCARLWNDYQEAERKYFSSPSPRLALLRQGLLARYMQACDIERDLARLADSATKGD